MVILKDLVRYSELVFNVHLKKIRKKYPNWTVFIVLLYMRLLLFFGEKDEIGKY